MYEKTDLVMWTKDGAATLPLVLNRINHVIPEDAVHKRIVIDDYSSDDTETISRKSGWSVYPNKGKGISDAANTALEYVESERFASFEQDVLLSPDWWRNIPKLLDHESSAIASGIRLPTQPLSLRRFIKARERRRKNPEDSDPFNYGKTLDNTIYRTEVLRKIGGFPKLPIHVQCMLDNVLAQRVYDAGFSWKVDYRVESLHIRKGLRDELRHSYWYGESEDFIFYSLTGKYPTIRDRQKLFLTSFLWGVKSALELNSPDLIYTHPMLQLAELKGLISDRKKGNSQRALRLMGDEYCARGV